MAWGWRRKRAGYEESGECEKGTDELHFKRLVFRIEWKLGDGASIVDVVLEVCWELDWERTSSIYNHCGPFRRQAQAVLRSPS